MIMVAALLIGAFLAITFVFNTVLSNFMESGANQLLSQAWQGAGGGDPAARPQPGDGGRLFQAVAGRAEAILLSSDYREIEQGFRPPDDNASYRADFIEAAFAARIDLGSQTVSRLESGTTLYYYTSIPYSAYEGSHIVYFINMSEIDHFRQTMTGILLLVLSGALALALAVTWLIAGRIAGPIARLSDFAVQIGEARYGTLEADFQDRELHNLRESMNETSRRLEEYDTEQKTFFQNASHELRTPLQIIKTNAEGVLVGIFDKDKAASTILRETDGLSEMVEDLLYISRLDSKSRDLMQTENDLRESLSYVISRYDSVLSNKGIRVEYDFSDTPVLFTYDEKTMERALQNLVSNAVRYTKDSIRLSCRRTSDRILIAIEDNGPGISDKDLPRIFDRFYKGENGKHGIGLSIVKSIVTSFGGRIEVSTSPRGTAFTIFLPVHS